MAKYGEIKTVTKKNPITGKTRIIEIIQGAPGLPAAKVVADMPEWQRKKKEEEEEKKKHKPFLPGPAGMSPYHKRRVEDGGKITRIKRK